MDFPSGLLILPSRSSSLLLSLGFKDTCMSTGDSSEVIELTLRIASLEITVRGPSRAATDFVAGLPQLAQHSSAATSGYHTPPVSARPPAASPASSYQSASIATRQSILDSFPECPACWISAAEERLGSSRKTPAQRARRAWLAGQWARAVLEGQVGTPARSETLELGNRFWCVVRCIGLSAPKVYTTSASFFQAVGALEGTDTVSSKVEAKIYLNAAGFVFPEEETQQ